MNQVIFLCLSCTKEYLNCGYIAAYDKYEKSKDLEHEKIELPGLTLRKWKHMSNGVS